MSKPPDRSVEGTFCFVDVAGFTALTEAHGDRAAADLIQRFGEMVQETLAAPGSIVDFIGDAVLVIYPEPTGALKFATSLFARAATEPSFPDLRAGLHHGPALERDGRYFGATLNLASRVAGHARGGQILATAPAASASRGFESVAIGSVNFRNVHDPVELFAFEIAGGDASRIDPVCRMRIDPGHASGRLRHRDTDYWFCSLVCAARFAADPDTYIADANERTSIGRGGRESSED
jgi:class 3 adenylate cyclase